MRQVRRSPSMLFAVAASLTSIVLVAFSAANAAQINFFILIYLSLTLAMTFSLREQTNYSSDTLFASGMLLRLAIVGIITFLPPTASVSSPAITGSVSGVVFEDEAFYLIQISTSSNMSLWDWLGVADQFDRVAIYYAAAQAFFGEGLLAGRLCNTMLLSYATVLIFRSVRSLCSPKTIPIAWWGCLLTPELLMWPSLHTKESVAILGIAMALYASVLVYKGRPQLGIYVLAAISAALLWYVRPAMLPLVPALFFSSLIARRNDHKRSKLFPFAVAGIVISFLVVRTSLPAFIDFAGLDQEYFVAQVDLARSGSYSFPFLDLAASLPAGAREIAFFMLLMINPVITSVWGALDPKSFSWLSIMMAASAITWWAVLPALPIALYAAIKRQSLWWLAILALAFIWFFVAANMRFGGGNDAFRYREAILPVTYLIAFKGFDYALVESQHSRRWRFYLKSFYAFAASLVALRGFGVFGG